ncbi:hypothetical protein D3OALGA1CA_5147 [Olavius algarvensis associated proteobacterium Delta 3]|nr:hypothetical protein D3OALGB2SA_3029 [Olavius algarvensis associated proteobacterium Delta 3]CAB5162545.1 hypothetical protein D3OALGA1CA_5147 [Olavius algarvensis associated proteobacterium Delta 3]
MNRVHPVKGQEGAGKGTLDSDAHDVAHAAAPTLALRIAFLVLCTLGTLLSADLLRLHVRVHTDSNYHALCAISETIDCESVAFSRYAVVAGLPVALWGLIGYLVMGGLCIWGLNRVRGASVWPFGILFLLSLSASLVSALLFSISAKLIHSLCILCIATSVVNFSLLALTIAELKRLKIGPISALREEARQLPGRRGSVSLFVVSAVVLVAVLKLTIPPYWHTEITEGPGGVLTGRNSEGAYWIGARKPVIEIAEFSDYQCPYCFRGHLQARKLVYEHPDSIRLVHLHFPLRQHPEAFQYSKMAYCAGEQGKFWEGNDFLFTNGRRPEPVTPQEFSSALGIVPAELTACLERETTRTAISEDMALGNSLNIQGTPTFVIDGNLYPGSIPKSVLSPLMPNGSLPHK